ncbi:bZIP transcription factor [Ferrimonas gelatinilytica]|uniref:KfrA N-terminal DNA-binding domain-containing protein n=1 Tax=Ferrimonas gelatinilytica TaxID=1255257 RepID=A0ABP9S4F8_9GAMM
MMEPEIRAALCRLHDTGPTLALLKKQTGHRFPLPMLISALQSYKANPDAFAEAPQTMPAAPEAGPSSASDLEELEHRVATLEALVTQLQAEIAQLLARQK